MTKRQTSGLLLLGVALLILLAVRWMKSAPAVPAADAPTAYGIGFYNVENLFDTLHDEGKNDYDFLPDGSYQWTAGKYQAKLANIARVVSELCPDATAGHAALVGIAEVENARALDDLVAQPALAALGFRYAHIEGADRRGIDCAVLYDPALFRLTGTTLVPYVDPENPGYLTRGFLVASGTLGGDELHVIVCHWPSRATGEEARILAGRQTRAVKDSLLRACPGSKVIVMGDLNDDPHDRSLAEGLACLYNKEEVTAADGMFNPWRAIHRPDSVGRGVGTLTYQGKWNLFDQIVVSGTLLTDDGAQLRYGRAEIFLRDYLLQDEGPDGANRRYAGTPLRTHAGGRWLNGYSDHLPTMIYLHK